MKTKFVLEWQDVQRILDAALKEARGNQWDVSIAVVDDGGHLLGFTRMDGAGALAAMACVGKAQTAALSRKPSRIFEEMVAAGRTAAVCLPLILLEGGEPLILDGTCVGAVGVSGVKSADDARIARAGAAAISAERSR